MTSPHLLIVSTGRTGTTALESYLNTIATCEVRQEPMPSRLPYVLSNIHALNIPFLSPYSAYKALRIYENSRQEFKSASKGKIYIEINPFLTNMVSEIVGSKAQPDAILHLVREPSDWVQSMINFGAYSWRRPLVKFMPFVYWRPPYGTSGWSKLSFAERLAHEWVWRNKCILEAEHCCVPYLRLRYEDVFKHPSSMKTSLKAVFDAFELPLEINTQTEASVKNASRRLENKTLSPKDLISIRKITRPLAEQFGYVKT